MTRRRLVWAALLLGLTAAGWGAFRQPGSDDLTRFRSLQREAARLRMELRAEPPDTPKAQELWKQWQAVNAEGWELARRHPEWGGRIE